MSAFLSGANFNFALSKLFISYGISKAFNNQIAFKVLSAKFFNSIVLLTANFGELNSFANLANSAGCCFASLNSVLAATQVPESSTSISLLPC